LLVKPRSIRNLSGSRAYRSSIAREWHEFRDAYNIARREFFTEVANKIKGGVMVVDLDGRIEVVAPSK
jgi:hypothetical protein